MKKFLTSMLVFALIGGLVFAEEEKEAKVIADGLKVKVSGSATVKWGMDLTSGEIKAEDIVHGFYNETNLAIKIPFFGTEQSFETKKEGDVYVDIAFNVKPRANRKVMKTATKEVNVSSNLDGKFFAYDIDAKLVFFGVYIKAYNKPTFASEYALGWDQINRDPFADPDPQNNWWNPEFKGWGTTIGFAKKEWMDLNVGLKLGSNRTWMTGKNAEKDAGYNPVLDGKTPQPLDTAYGVGLDFHMMPVEKYLAIDATVNSTLRGKHEYESGIEIGGGKEGKSMVTNFGLKLSSEPIDKLKIGLGFDGATGVPYTDKDKNATETFGWDLGFTVGYKWVDFALYVCGTGTDLHGVDLSGNVPWMDGPNMATHLGFKSEAEGDTNFIPGLDIHASINAYDLLSKKSSKTLTDSEAEKCMEAKKNFSNKEADDKYKKDYEEWLDKQKNSSLVGKTVAEIKKAFEESKEGKEADMAKKTTYATNKESLGGFYSLTTVPLGLNIGASYKWQITDAMSLKPFFDVYGETNHYKNKTDEKLKKTYFGIAYNVGLTFSPVEKAEITAEWSHGKLAANSYEGGTRGQYMISDPANNKCHNGTFTLGLKLMW